MANFDSKMVNFAKSLVCSMLSVLCHMPQLANSLAWYVIVSATTVFSTAMVWTDKTFKQHVFMLYRCESGTDSWHEIKLLMVY